MKEEEFSPGDDEIPRFTNNWTINVKKRLQAILDAAVDKQEAHTEATFFYKKLYALFALPAIIIPAIVAPVLSIAYGSAETECMDNLQGYQLYATVSFILTGVFSVITHFFRFDELRAEHNNFSSRFASLVSKISEQFAKSSEFRQNAESFLLESRLTYGYLEAEEPILPYHIHVVYKRTKHSSSTHSMPIQLQNISLNNVDPPCEKGEKHPNQKSNDPESIVDAAPSI
jgi:hypothetical protein